MTSNYITQFFYEVWGTVNGKYLLLRRCSTYTEAVEYANTIRFYAPIIETMK